MRKSRAVGLGRVPEAGKDAGKGRKAFRRHVEEPAHGAYFPLPRAGRGWKALARGGRGGPQAPRFAAQGRKESSGNCACGACASRGRQAVRRRVRAKGSGGNRAGARAASVSRRRERRGRDPQEGQAAGAGLRVCRCWAGPRPMGRTPESPGQSARLRHAAPLRGGMTPGRCSAGSSCRCAVADHAGGNGRCGALCRPEGAALSSPGPAGGTRKCLAGLSLPGGIPCSSAFSALEGTARRQGRRGRGCGAQGGRDQSRGNALAGRRAAYRVARRAVPLAQGRAASAAGRRGAEGVFRMAHLSEILPFPCRRERRGGRPGAGPRGSKSRAAGARPGGECRSGARKGCSAWPIYPESFLFHAGGNGAGEGREPGRGGSKSRAASHGARRRVPQGGGARKASE